MIYDTIYDITIQYCAYQIFSDQMTQHLLKELQGVLPAPRRQRFHRRAEALPLRATCLEKHDGSPVPGGGTAAHQDLGMSQGAIEAGNNVIL